MGKIISINVSEKKGTIKHEVSEVNIIEDYGIKGDAHAGKWHRQVSLLNYEDFLQFKDEVKIPMEHGVFGENLLVSGINFHNIKIGDIFRLKEVVLEVTQIGKECHKGCEIRNIVGRCIMPTEGVFAKVLKGGIVEKGEIVCLEQ